MFDELIAELKSYKNKIYHQIIEIDKVIVTLDGLDRVDKQAEPPKPVIVPKIKTGKKMRGKYKKRAAMSEEPKHIPGLRGPRKRASKYKGISPCKPRKDGTHLWRVQYWENGKNKSLGQFESPELAGAAYAERTGDHAEAARLRAMAGRQKTDMAEQAENNPDRARRVTIYICTHCKTEWQSKPDSCPHCKSVTFNAQKVDADKV
jgi:rubrerythrin